MISCVCMHTHSFKLPSSDVTFSRLCNSYNTSLNKLEPLKGATSEDGKRYEINNHKCKEPEMQEICENIVP